MSDLQRKRKIIGLAIAATAALGLQVWTIHGDSTAFLDHEVNENSGFPRSLMAESVDQSYTAVDIPDWLLGDESAGGEEYTKNLEVAMAAAIEESKLSSGLKTIAPYDIKTLMGADALFSVASGVVVYDPDRDNFLLFHNIHKKRLGVAAKMFSSFKGFSVMLRNTFPDRFQGPGSKEFAIAISSGDFPHIVTRCRWSYPHISGGCPGSPAPILTFGSVFRNTEMFPNMIAGPMPTMESLHCFKTFPLSKRTQGCRIVTIKESPAAWETLIPQVVWRGTDFNYLNTVLHLERASISRELEEKLKTTEEATRKTALTQSLKDRYEGMMPRWKAVVLTAESEIEAEENGTLPWANMKFSKQAAASAGNQYALFAEYGVEAAAGRMKKAQMAEYKYQIDLGGGGGTTWSGTIEKLGMPGLLFHHTTPTKDYVHNQMKAWIHFIPVASHLRDLKEKVEWAESHPQAAKMIAAQASAMVMNWATAEGFGEMYDEVLKQPIQMAMDAYQPVGSSYKDVIEEFPLMKCAMACHGRKKSGGCIKL